MAKQKKKRTKVYNGIDAAVTRPSVTRIQAANRSRLGQWWFDKKKIAKPIIIASLVVIVVLVLIIELIRLIGS